MTATYTMEATPTVKFSGPFTVRYTRSDGREVERGTTWRGLRTILPVVGRMAGRGKVHSIEVLDRHNNDVTFASDILPLLEDITVVTATV